jgi:hypothetical protein
MLAPEYECRKCGYTFTLIDEAVDADDSNIDFDTGLNRIWINGNHFPTLREHRCNDFVIGIADLIAVRYV